MAETVTSAALDYLLRKITSAIENEASLIGGLSDEFDAIKRKFITMRYVLQDADENGVLTRVDKDWVDNVRDISHEVEDVIDEFMYHMNMQRNGGKCTRLLHQIVLFPKSLLVRHRVATKLQKINRKITEIDEARRNFAIDGREVNQRVDYEQLRQHDAEASIFIKDKLVGIEHDERLLLELLTDQTKRYIVVLDDVWSSQFWDEIRVSLPDDGSGSRVMLTTRDNNIARSLCSRRHIHEVRPMRENEAWELFCMKAFANNEDKSCPEELKSLAENLVGKCEGLPLAIVALGAAMSSKKLKSEWKKVNDSLDFELMNNRDLQYMQAILLLSFYELPYKLKLCFLYCCLFPEDYVIKRKRLIRLLMAEGLVEKARGLSPEDVAESYLMELIQRNMLQVVMRNILGRPKECKMHDLVREIALPIAVSEKFCALYDDQETSEECGARRLSIQKIKEQIKSLKGMSQLRSLLVFIVDKKSPSMVTLPSGLRLLRVLDLQGAPVEKLPNEVVDLLHLRYLNLRGTKVEKLPKSIGRLCNLQTLDIRNSRIEMLPTGITKLQNLRHLLMYRTIMHYDAGFKLYCGIPAPPNICGLENLQVLDIVEAEADLMGRIGSLTQLTKLGIANVGEADQQNLCNAIQSMNSLHHLLVMVSNEKVSLQMDTLPAAPPHLKSMVLIGKLEVVPHWFSSLKSLAQLHLHWSTLTEDFLPSIKDLPSLGRLELNNAYSGNQLKFTAGYQKLKILYLINLPQLDEIIIEESAMRDLLELHLHRCEKLKTLPSGIEHLTSVQELELRNVSSELVQLIHGEQGVVHPSIQHIPVIRYW
ncbi:unnamed protein product [Ilex paraguariensis]|uniref:Disease resistance protein RPM1 n=1 Tax=Ilex paraguariensis TaxID=185542 RepID=A0ABC8RPY1_9AQUA